MYVSTLKYAYTRVICLYPAAVDDYLPITSFTITFSTIVPRRTVCEQVTLIDDNIVEATESFQFSFDAVTPGVVIDSPDITTINIVDNDGIHIYVYTCTYVHTYM